MSSGRPGMHLHQFHGTRRQSAGPTSRLYQQTEVPGNLPAPSPPNTMLGVNSHFEEFDFPYQAMPGQAGMVLPDLAGVDFERHHQPDAFSIHHAMGMTSAPPSHSMNNMAVMPGQSYIAPPDPQRASVENSDSQGQEKTSPASNSVDDANTDEFGLSGQSNRGDGTDLGVKSKDGSAPAPPAWSELKTKAGKDRKRLPLACIACRRKKIRCSGEKPACKHCMRSRIPCVYKVTTRKAAPRTDYMAMLDKRLKRMEERIIKILPKSDAETVSSVPRSVVKPAIPGTGTISSKTASRKRNADDAFGSDLEAWAKAPRPKMPDEDTQGSPRSQEAERDELFREGIDALPSKEDQEHLAEVYFDHVYGQSYQLLHKPSYMRKLKSGALPPVLVLSVCAIAARFASNPKFNSTNKRFMRGEEWASHAREICTKRYDWPNITILTCLLILGMHEFGTCHGGRAWALGGQAIRMAFALHLHRDLDYDPQTQNRNVKLSFIDREIRRRVMWACFLMDRFNSSGTDRPMFIREETISTPLPVSEKCFQYDMPAQTEYLDGRLPSSELPDGSQSTDWQDNMGVSAYIIRSIAIWGRIITYINQGGREQDLHPMWSDESEYAKLVRDAENIHTSLPSLLQYSRETLDIHRTDTTANQFLFLHMSIQQNHLYLNQAAVTLSQTRVGEKAPGNFVPEASAKTLAAANRISDFLRDAEEAQCNISTPFAGYCAFSSTAIHITGMFSGNQVMKATAEANSGVNVRYLRKMMSYWGMFHWMLENIRTQFRNAVDAARSGGPTNGSTASSPILQYSDWFNRYPHGVSDTDYMDPAMYRKKERGEDGALEQKPELTSVGDFFTSVESTQSKDNKDGSRGPAPKRKTPSKKQTAATTIESEQPKAGERTPPEALEQSAMAQTGNPLQQQHSQPNNEQRRFSAPMVEQAGGTPTFNSLTMSQSQPSPYSHFSQSTPQSGFFTPDTLSINMGQQPDGVMQLLDGGQISFGGFSMDSGGVPGSQNLMDGAGGWGGIPANAVPSNAQIHNQQNLKANGINSAHPPVPPQNPHEGLNHFDGQEPSPAWFMTLEGNQDMGLGGNMDAFAGLFGGGTSGMPIADHREGL